MLRPNKTRRSVITTSIQHCIGVPASAIRREKNFNCKGNSKLSLFINDMIVYIEYPRNVQTTRSNK